MAKRMRPEGVAEIVGTGDRGEGTAISLRLEGSDAQASRRRQLMWRVRHTLSRRQFVAATGGALAVSALPVAPVLGQGARAAGVGPDATQLAPSATPLRFMEIVNFRGDFGGTEVDNPKGVAYQPALNRIIVSLSPYTVPYGHRVQILNAVDAGGGRSRFAPTYTMYRDVESMLAIVPLSGPPVTAGFQAGDLFVGRGKGDEISRLSATGAVLSDVWANPGTGSGLWGGIAFDTTGTFNGRLIATTTNGKIFGIDASGHSTLLKDLGLRLEGVAVAPAGFGPLSGQIMIGVEGTGDSDPATGRVYALSNTGSLTLIANIDFAAETINFVPPEGGTYYQAELCFDRERENRLLAITASQFLGHGGRMLVVNELGGELWEIAWDGTQYTETRVARAPGRWSSQGFNVQGTELEGGTFAVRPPALPHWTNWSAVPGNGTTDRAPAASVDASGNLHLLAKGINDRQIYMNSMFGSTLKWTGWVQIPPGGLTTRYPLASALQDGVLFAFAVRDDGAIMYKRLFVGSGQLTSDPWTEVPGGGRTDAGVAAVTSNGRLVLAAKGIGDKQIYLNEMEPGARGDWSGWQVVPASARSNLAPALAAFGDELYVLTVGLTSGRVLAKVRSADGFWTDAAEIPGSGTTDQPIAATTAGGQLYLFAKGINDRAPYANVASDTGTWSRWIGLPNGGTTDAGTAAAAIGNRLFLFAKGINDRQIYMRYTT